MIINPYRFAAAGLIQSIQTFSITIGTGSTSNTATITSVNTANALIIWGGMTTTYDTDTRGDIVESRVTLTNGTTVTATRDTSDATHTTTVKGTVVEFKTGKIQSMQYGTITIAATSTSNTATISSVTTGNSAVQFLGQTTTSNNGSSQQRQNARLALTNATTVTATRENSNNDVTVSFVVIEFATGILNSNTQAASISLATTTVTDTATITGVTAGQTMLVYGGFTTSRNEAISSMIRATLTNGTTITANKDAGATLGTAVINVTAVEFKTADIAGVDRGTITISAATSNTATIGAVDTTKAVVNYLGISSSDVSDSAAQIKTTEVLTNSTTVTAAVNTTVSANVASYEVIEFV